MTSQWFPNTMLQNLWKKIPANIKLTFSASFIFGILVHAFMLTNKFPNGDDLNQLVDSMNRPGSGRWFLTYPAGISGIFSIPWVNGLLCIIYISISACLVVSLLGIKQNICCILVGGLMISFPTVAGTFTYMATADAYFFCLMLTCLTAYIAERYKYGYIIAAILLAIAMGGYQAYYGVTAGLLIMVLIFEVLNNGVPWRKIVFKGMRFMVLLGFSMVLYLGMVKLTIPDSGLSTHMGLNTMGRITLPELIRAVIYAYGSIFYYYVFNLKGFHFWFMGILFAASFVACAVLVVLWCIRQKLFKEPLKVVLLIVLLLLFPFGCNIIFVMSPQSIPHLLMIYGTVLILVFLLAIIGIYAEKLSFAEKNGFRTFLVNASCWIIILSACLCLFNYWIVDNKAYFKMFFTYEVTYAETSVLISRIQSHEQYEWDMETVLVGTPTQELQQGGFTELNEFIMRGTRGSLFGHDAFVKYLNRYFGFMNVEYLSEGIVQDNDIAAVIADMPIYPKAGSIAAIDGKIYVKFSNVEETEKKRIATILSNVKNLMEKMGWSFEQTVDVLGIAETDRKQLSELMN